MRQLDEATIMADLLPGENLYPIYRVNVRWPESYPPGAEQRIVRPNLPPLPAGRFWNSTGWYTMERVERPVEALVEQIVTEWWPRYCKRLLEPGEPCWEVYLVARDVWCSGWFSHHTFDVGLSDDDVLLSFERYVTRIEHSTLSESERGGLLMSAEDRWRWHGCVNGDPRGERTPAPCRCEHCKKAGLIRIDH